MYILDIFPHTNSKSNYEERKLNLMKATGIVRRIDDLGRIVVPKEIRRTLRIREGDPMEIFTDREGEIILKKYSPLGEMADFATQYAKALSQSTGMVTMITDREKVVAVGGTTRKDIVGSKISHELDRLISGRETLMASRHDSRFVQVLEGDYDFSHEIICPILADSDVIGSVILVAKDASNNPSDTDLKLAACGAGFMGMQIE